MADVLIVGCGFAGAVIARELADRGHDILLLEKRPHIAGNMYEEPMGNGVRVHRYGPHIFHTRVRAVYDWLCRFTDFFPYEHHVLGAIAGQLVPIPFNFASLAALFPAGEAAALRGALLAAYPGGGSVSVHELLQSTNPAVHSFGQFVFEKVFLHYTEKQWGKPVGQVDPATLARVPVRLNEDGRYFEDAFQFMPAQGYTPLFERILDHPRIHVELNCDALARFSADTETGVMTLDGARWEHPVVWTGPIDALLGCRFGPLPYRSLDMHFEEYPVDVYQPAAVVNYPGADVPFTRITEFKHMTKQGIPGATAVLREFPLDYDPADPRAAIPYYPVPGVGSLTLYRRYRDAFARVPGLYFCGRLAEYRYYIMDAVVKVALETAQTILP